MLRLLQYYGKYQSARGVLGGLPGWAKFILLIAALPGILGILLSILALWVSLAALLLLAVPVYRLLNWLTGGRREVESEPADEGPTDFVDAEVTSASSIPTTVVTSETSEPQRPRRQIDVKIVE